MDGTVTLSPAPTDLPPVSSLDAGQPTLPPEAPLAMPEQSLREGSLQVRHQRTSPMGIGLRRFYLIGGTLTATAVAVW